MDIKWPDEVFCGDCGRKWQDDRCVECKEVMRINEMRSECIAAHAKAQTVDVGRLIAEIEADVDMAIEYFDYKDAIGNPRALKSLNKIKQALAEAKRGGHE